MGWVAAKATAARFLAGLKVKAAEFHIVGRLTNFLLCCGVIAPIIDDFKFPYTRLS